jgi:hypothetical protein
VGHISEAASKKREAQLAGFREEMEQITSSGGTARSIRIAMDELRKKYGLE